jgi:phosphate transport system substrate-binding protein
MNFDNGRYQSWVFPAIAFIATTGAFGAIFGLGWWFTLGQVDTESIELTTPQPQDQARADKLAKVQLNPSQTMPQGLFSYSSSDQLKPLKTLFAHAINTTYPDFKLNYSPAESNTQKAESNTQRLITGQLAFTLSSNQIKPEEKTAAAQQGFELAQVPVAFDGIAIVVHPDLPIKTLTLTQLKDIYTGQITNWSALGGPNLAITPFALSFNSGELSEFFVQKVMGDQAVSPQIVRVSDTTSGLKKVTQTRGAITYVAISDLAQHCTLQPVALANTANETFVKPLGNNPAAPTNPAASDTAATNCASQPRSIDRLALQNRTYPLAQSLYVIIKVNGALEEQAGRAYAKLLLSPEGQQAIEQIGMVGLP